MESGRRTLLLGALAAGAAGLGGLSSLPAAAARIARVGILEYHPRGHELSTAQAIADAMAKLGYVEGKDIEYLHRNPQAGPYETLDARLAPVVDALVRAKPDAILTTGTSMTKALVRATTTIPI